MKPCTNAGSNVALKDAEREQLAADVAWFLSKGGKPYEAKHGESAEKQSAFYNRYLCGGFSKKDLADIRERLAKGQTFKSVAYRYKVPVSRIKAAAGNNKEARQ